MRSYEVPSIGGSMGVPQYSLFSPYTVLMAVLWFNVFVGLSLLMRKLKYPVKFSVLPLVVLLVLSLVRMFAVVRIPGSMLVFSESLFPAIVNFLRLELVPHISISHALLILWISVSVTIMVRYGLRCRRVYWDTMALTYARDSYAESLMEEITDKHVRVFRANVRVAFTVGFKPYIFLPNDLDFPREELLTILRHEWKHIEDKDYLVLMITKLICAVFWWNPMVYVLKRNVSFALELKCDYYAAGDLETDYDNYREGVIRFGRVNAECEPPAMVTALINSADEFIDRFDVLALSVNDRSRWKRPVANACFFVLVGVLFVMSYMFVVQPAFWESDVVSVDCFSALDYQGYRAGETFIADNGDGTFSLYIDGQIVEGVGEFDLNLFNFVIKGEHIEN